MSTLHQNPQNFNHILTELDLIEQMAAHHKEQAAELTRLAIWHQIHAECLAVERAALAADVMAALAEAERLLK